MCAAKKTPKTPEEQQAILQKLIAQGRKDGMIRADELRSHLEEMDLSPEKIEEIYDNFEAMNIQVVSDDMDLDLDDALVLEDDIDQSDMEDERTPGPADATSNAMLADALKEILDTLTEREADVLRMRFGMYDGRTHTLEELGQIFGVTRERIRQIENKAIRKTLVKTRKSRYSLTE